MSMWALMGGEQLGCREVEWLRCRLLGGGGVRVGFSATWQHAVWARQCLAYSICSKVKRTPSRRKRWGERVATGARGWRSRKGVWPAVCVGGNVQLVPCGPCHTLRFPGMRSASSFAYSAIWLLR